MTMGDKWDGERDSETQENGDGRSIFNMADQCCTSERFRTRYSLLGSAALNIKYGIMLCSNKY